MKTKAQEAAEKLRKIYENSEDEVVFFLGTNKKDDTINTFFNGTNEDIIYLFIGTLNQMQDLRKVIEIALKAVKAKEEEDTNKEE